MGRDVGGASLSVGPIQGQTIHVQLICHICLVDYVCYKITAISESFKASEAQHHPVADKMKRDSYDAQMETPLTYVV